MNAPSSADLESTMRALGTRARIAARELRDAPAHQRDAAILAAAAALRARAADILAANAEDLRIARQSGLGAAMLDRLSLAPQSIESLATSLEQIAALPDPVGRELASWTRPNGLVISRIATPIGVIGMIYESRPNVTADASALCVKSGNAVILRGGSDSTFSSAAIHRAMVEGLRAARLREDTVQLVPSLDRAAVGLMLAGLSGSIDLIIPRGGKSLVARVQAEARVPVLAHLEGNCHVYVHQSADPSKACAIVLNSKMRRTGVCGAAETLLIDRPVVSSLGRSILEALAKAGCEIRGDEEILKLFPAARLASEADWDTEFLDAIIAVKVVADVAEAINHIETHGSHHTEAIIAEDQNAATLFLSRLDSAIVMWNASTQFADGGEFGMGAEIGIGTGKLHARGPVGVEQLTSFKYVVRGNGQVRP